MAAAWPSLFQPPADKEQQQGSCSGSSRKQRRSSSAGGGARSTKFGRRATSSSAAAQQQQHHAHSQLARSPLGLGVVVATSLYCGVKAGIQGYQHLRRRNLRHLVRHVSPVLDKLGIQYWADFGTLLGMYREKDIILHDNDADLVLLNPDWEALLPALKAALPGCRVFYVVPSEDPSIRWIRVMAGIGVMDLYGAFADASSSSMATTGKAAGGAMVTIPQGHGDLCDVPSSLIFPLSVMKFRGVPVSVPGDVSGVLRYRYGDTFMIPRYMDKGRDCIEQGKFYARLLAALGKAGLRV